MTMTSPQVAARAGAGAAAGQPSRRASRRSWAGWWFIGPFMAVFALVFLAPIAYSIYLSVFRNQLIGGTAFVGLDNYARALGDAQFWSALGRVSLFLAVQVPVMLFIALVVALALDSGRLYGRSFFRISIFLPYAVPAVVATLMWGFMYGTRFGLVGNINQAFGLNLPSPLSSELVLASIGNIVTWEFIGYNMLIFYSALTVIPKSLYEAAEIDGAGQLRVITAIKLPAIRGAIVVASIFSVIGSFQLFNEPSILKSLSPNTISTYFTPNLYAFSLSFSGQQYNYSATVAIIMGLITMAIAYAVQVRGMRKER
jgi:multiple sugar transport system permease protein